MKINLKINKINHLLSQILMIQDKRYLLTNRSSKYYLQVNNRQTLILKIKPKIFNRTNKDSNLENKRVQF